MSWGNAIRIYADLLRFPGKVSIWIVFMAVNSLSTWRRCTTRLAA
jgi:hypothetical protein